MLTRREILAAIPLLLTSSAQAEDVETLIKRLGSKNFREREKSQRMIERVLDDPKVIEAIHQKHADAEIERRLSALRTQYFEALKPLSLPHFPWIDMLPGTDVPDAKRIERHYLGLSGGHGRGPIWEGDIQATRFYVRDMIAEQIPTPTIQGIMRKMEDVQRKSVWWPAYEKAITAQREPSSEGR